MNKARRIDSEAETEDEVSDVEPIRPNITDKIEDHKARLAAKGIMYVQRLYCLCSTCVWLIIWS